MGSFYCGDDCVSTLLCLFSFLRGARLVIDKEIFPISKHTICTVDEKSGAG